MNPNYISWFKDIDHQLQGRKDSHQLMSSNVYEPLEMLEKQVKDNWGELLRLQSYCNDWGHPVLRQRIAERYGVAPSNVLLASGCTNASYLATVSHLNPGDTFVCESPAYQPVWHTARRLGARIKWLKRRPPHYAVDLDELDGLIDRKTSLVALTNLHNPSGTYLDDRQLADIARTVRRKNPKTRILMDEVFRDFLPGRPRPACTVDRAYISTGSLSKVYGLSHLACGWILADKKTIDGISPLMVSCIGTGSRYLEALSAMVFERLNAYLARSNDIVARNRKELIRTMGPLITDGLLSGGPPDHGCVYFPKVEGLKDTERLAERLIRKYRLYVVPGKFFGAPAHIRIGYGSCPEKVRPALELLARAITETKR
jgi:aspartate/methionine/tyrosine aminotransferase